MFLDLWEQITDLEALKDAWRKVRDNDGSAGGDHINLKDFHSDLFANINQLRSDILSGNYRSGPFRKVGIAKKKGGYRTLTIPSIRDRLLHTSIANALTPILEPLFEECSFAYRPGKGVVKAAERIERWHRAGFDIVIETDIVSYFDNIDQEILIEKIEAILLPLSGGTALTALIKIILEDQASALGKNRQGIAQGSPLSPLLANLYLDALDEEIEAQGVKIVRFADDFVILCKTDKQARRALSHCRKVLDAHGLKLHEDRTRIVNFEKALTLSASFSSKIFL